MHLRLKLSPVDDLTQDNLGMGKASRGKTKKQSDEMMLRATQGGPSGSSSPVRKAFGVGLLVGFLGFLIQQGCSLTGNLTNWI